MTTSCFGNIRSIFHTCGGHLTHKLAQELLVFCRAAYVQDIAHWHTCVRPYIEEHLRALAHTSLITLHSLEELDRTASLLPGAPLCMDLSFRPCGEMMLRRLMCSPYMSQVMELDLRACGIRDEDIEVLVYSTHLDALTCLNLQHNKIRSHGAILLAQATNLPALAKLDLSENKIKAEGALALAESPHALRQLELARNYITLSSVPQLKATRHGHLYRHRPAESFDQDIPF